MSRASVIALAAVALLVTSGIADAKRANKKTAVRAACDIGYLPFAEGVTWNYQYVIPPGAEEQPGAIKANDPETLSIRVASVEGSGKSAVITLEESYRNVVRKTVLSCTDQGLQVPLDSFYFAGELPGALGMGIEGITTKGELYPGKAGLKKGDSFYVEMRGDVDRVAAGDAKAKHLKANLQVERQITVGSKAEVEVEHGIHSAYAVEVAISGRVTLEPTPDKQVPMPEGNAMLWFAPNVGLVRAYNRLGQGWELTSHTDAAGQEIPF